MHSSINCIFEFFCYIKIIYYITLQSFKDRCCYLSVNFSSRILISSDRIASNSQILRLWFHHYNFFLISSHSTRKSLKFVSCDSKALVDSSISSLSCISFSLSKIIWIKSWMEFGSWSVRVEISQSKAYVIFAFVLLLKIYLQVHNFVWQYRSIRLWLRVPYG